MRILAVSDVELGFIHSPMVAERFRGVDLVISCGDLPFYYLDYIASMLNVPLYFVHGNHVNRLEHSDRHDEDRPMGAIDLHRRPLRSSDGLLLAGIEGSLQYNQGAHQYTQAQMWRYVLGMAPALFINKMRFGRYLDVFVSHAPPWNIHDMEDLPHRGIKAFRWFLRVFEPTYHLHGHIHIYRQDTVRVTQFFNTQVINTYGYREITFNWAELTRRPVIRTARE